MNKQIFLLFVAFLSALHLEAQVKKYPLIEHFTNTRCGSCAANNPGFYAKTLPLINSSVHHISYHPSFPYASCQLYQSNTSENSGRAEIYGVNSTPTFILNGGPVQSLSSFSSATLNAELLKTSPLQLKVKEKDNGGSWTAKIELSTFGVVPAGKYRIVAALCEKKLNYSAPNGEKLHYDVFRKMLTAVKGNDIANMPAAGNQIEFSYNYTIDAGWDATQIYVLAWVINADTREVINSGSRFTAVSSAEDLAIPDDISVYPNPASQEIVIDLSRSESGALEYELLNPLAQVIQRGVIKSNRETVKLPDFSYPYFVLRLITEKGVVNKTVLRK